MVVDQLPRLGKRELVCLLLFTCKYVGSVWRGFLFLLVLGMGYVILLWHSLSLPYNYFTFCVCTCDDGLSHPYHLDESTFSIRGIGIFISFLFHISMKFM